MQGEPIMERKGRKSQEVAILGIFIALTFLFTMINIKLPVGQGGLIHLGNIPFFLAAILFGKKMGAIVGGFGMGAFDLLNGWIAWAPFTFIIVGVMGFAVGAITEKKKNVPRMVFAIVVALAIKVVGYYITEVILYHNWITPFASIPGNIMQIVVAGIVVVVISAPMKKAFALFGNN